MSTAIITVELDGRVASWDGQDFTGDPDMVREARAASTEERTVDILGLFPVEAAASAEKPVAALAALSALNPGRVFVTHAPAEVTDWLDGQFAQRACTDLE